MPNKLEVNKGDRYSRLSIVEERPARRECCLGNLSYLINTRRI